MTNRPRGELSKPSSWWLPLLAALSCGCSVIVDADSDQCQSTSECITRGGAFAQSVCSP
jgi:hypothetical protein